jgi:hypothetical protein
MVIKFLTLHLLLWDLLLVDKVLYLKLINLSSAKLMTTLLHMVVFLRSMAVLLRSMVVSDAQ